MQIWLLPALIGALLWTAVSIFDNFSFKRILNRPSQGLIISGIFSGFGILLVPSWWNIISPNLFFYAFIGGVLLQASQFFYFSCLDDEDLSDIVIYGSTYPFFVALIVVFLGKNLSFPQWVGMFFVLIGVMIIEWKRKILSRGFNINIVGYVICLSFSSIIVDHLLDYVTFVEAVLPYCLGLVFGGLFPLLIMSERKAFFQSWPRINRSLSIFGLVEMVNIVALLCEVLAMSWGHPALVNTVASSEPVFILVFSEIVSRRSLFKDFFPKSVNIGQKLTAVFVVLTGLFLISYDIYPE